MGEAMGKMRRCRAAAGLLATALFAGTGQAGEPAASDARAASLLVEQREAETRKAIAEADRAELLAYLPPSASKPLQGQTDIQRLGAAGLVKAFDLALQLARQVCTALPPDRATTVYDPAASQGVSAARTVSDGLARLTEDLTRENKALQAFIEAHTPQGSAPLSPLLVGLTVVPATVRAAADFSALFKTDLSAAGMAYGDGARALFITALSQSCPERIAGLGSGYLGELDGAQHEQLLARLRALGTRRSEFANRLDIVQRMADAAKADEKRALNAAANAASAVLKNVDAFVESLRAGEASERSPLFNAARYLAYANRINGALVLDIDLRLEGLTLLKEGLFGGQRLRLAGVAFLWYRLYEPNGALRAAQALRRVSAPVEVDLRGAAAGGDFWSTAR